MSINELLKQSGVKFNQKDAMRLGKLVMNKAKESGVRWQKKKELVDVNDFPETFAGQMQETAINYFKSKTNQNAK